jgi:bacterioferritin-associated ferredoxin
VEVAEVSRVSDQDNSVIVRVYAPSEYARKIAGIRVQEVTITNPMDQYVERIQDDTIICRCERVTAGEIRELIRQGYRDLNEIKTVSRAMMGACGSKTCSSLIHRLFLDEGIDPQKIMAQTRRPIFIEVELGCFAGATEEKSE